MSRNLVKYIERRNTNCEKWDSMSGKFGEEGLLPLWVADMDFEVADCIKKDLHDYIEHGVFGYYSEPDSYVESFLNWQQQYFDYKIEKEWVQYSAGVVTGVHMLIRAMTEVNDSVIVLTPVYYPFFDAVKKNDRQLVCCDLIHTDGIYTVDFEAFEQKIIDNDVKLFILCSPHNPVGRVWLQEELIQMYEICKKHHVEIVSDEIHQDMVMEGYKHYPLASLVDTDRVVTITACTKTFNLAAFQNSFVVIPNSDIREAFDKVAYECRVIHGSGAGYVAVASGYRGGRPWLDELLGIIKENHEAIQTLIDESGLDIVLTPLEGTYLTWIDLSKVLQGRTCKEIVQDKARVAVDYGDWFGGDSYKEFIRINLATKKENVVEAMNRILTALK